MDDMEKGRQAYVKGQFDEAFRVWLPLAEAGNMEAQAWVGSMYANGDAVDVDDARAHGWYLKAAEQGHAMAQANVGANCFMARGIDVDLNGAVKWLTAAADNKDQNRACCDNDQFAQRKLPAVMLRSSGRQRKTFPCSSAGR